jgi:hypothetical protein
LDSALLEITRDSAKSISEPSSTRLDLSFPVTQHGHDLIRSL